MKISDRHKFDRPREKLQARGASALSDLELLQALIGSGNAQAGVSKIAHDALKAIKAHGANVTYEQLARITGMGSAKISELLASLELSKRYLLDSHQPIIDSLQKAAAQLEDIRHKKQEYFVSLTLDGANRLIAKRTITIGTLTSSLVHPREVFADAITDRAASIIVAHNHPSGIERPSQDDKDITAKLIKAGAIIGIQLIDHIIVTKNTNISII